VRDKDWSEHYAFSLTGQVGVENGLARMRLFEADRFDKTGMDRLRPRSIRAVERQVE
jgi:hypothetical protein